MPCLRPEHGALLLALFALPGCPAQDGKERAEAARVSRAVDALRAADNAKKPEFLQALREQSCDEPEVCAVRSVCVAAYELHVGSLESAASAVTQAGDGGDPLAAASALGAAQTALDRARKLAEDCTRAQGDLIRHRRL
ncbi:MAG TPA: hypothetical protein VGK73_36485 [Polyangiaceae bacterium]